MKTFKEAQKEEGRRSEMEIKGKGLFPSPFLFMQLPFQRLQRSADDINFEGVVLERSPRIIGLLIPARLNCFMYFL